MEVAKPDPEKGLLANENTTEYGSDGNNGDKPETVRVGTESGDRYVSQSIDNTVAVCCSSSGSSSDRVIVLVLILIVRFMLMITLLFVIVIGVFVQFALDRFFC